MDRGEVRGMDAYSGVSASTQARYIVEIFPAVRAFVFLRVRTVKRYIYCMVTGAPLRVEEDSTR